MQSTGDFLLNKLPEHPNHPKGRNPYAHVALKVKTKFGISYKDLPDDKIGKNIVVIFLKKCLQLKESGFQDLEGIKID